MMCPHCCEEMVETVKQDSFQYGFQPGIELFYTAPHGTCAICDMTYTDYRAEEARDEAVRKHLAEARQA